jgi:hypothetical protein
LTINHAVLHAYARLAHALFAPRRAAPAAAAGVPRPVVAGPQPSLLDRIDRWFDGLTDDRGELERYLNRAQNVADLENRMRDALQPPPPLRF